MDKLSTLRRVLRVLIVPMLFVVALIRHPVAQWSAFTVLLVWLGLEAYEAHLHSNKGKGEEKDPKVDEVRKALSKEPVEDLSKTELFVLRQINHRITEQLKQVFPSVAWLWVKRPTMEALESGGIWRIQLSNAEEYNFAEVALQDNGAMTITLLVSSPLQVPVKLAEEEPPAAEDLKETDVLDRTDALTWYQEYGGNLLSSMIDDLNAQGYKRLTLNDDGEVLVVSGKKEIAVDKLEWFLPRIAWAEFCTLLKEDGIMAEEETTGLVLTW